MPAYLHDVVEDTHITSKEIEKKFGKRVATLVKELTDEFVTEKYPNLNRKSRKEKEVERQARMSKEAKTVKLADVIDNTLSIVENDPNFARKYLHEMDKLTMALKGGDEELWQQARKDVQKGRDILKKKLEV